MSLSIKKIVIGYVLSIMSHSEPLLHHISAAV
jgi:hypothetical protein